MGLSINQCGCALCVKGRKSILVELRRNIGIEPVDIGSVLGRKSLISQHYPCTLENPSNQLLFGHFQDSCSQGLRREEFRYIEKHRTNSLGLNTLRNFRRN